MIWRPTSLGQARPLEPAFGHILPGGHAVQVEHLVLQVEVQLAVEKASQVLVDEEVGVVAADVLAQVVLQAGDRVFPVDLVFAGQGS